MYLGYVVNSDFFFLSHRLPLALAAVRRGWDVAVIAPNTGRKREIEGYGFNFIELRMDRSRVNPWHELNTIRFLRSTFGAQRFDLIHLVTSKPIFYGTMGLSGHPLTPAILSISGLGYTFMNTRNGLRKDVMKRLYKYALTRNASWAVFQNKDDYDMFRGSGIAVPERSVLIRGSGVDTVAFSPSHEPKSLPVVVLPARMLWDKGVGEFLDAARVLKRRGTNARFVLVGDVDYGNPAAVGESTLRGWVADGVIEWWGYRRYMPEVYRQSTIVVLPSYREGLSKVLLEAGASARAIVTTDVPGCRDVVGEGAGLLVPARDPEALADAIYRLLIDQNLRDTLRWKARERVVQNFSERLIVEQHFELYERLLGIKSFDEPAVAGNGHTVHPEDIEIANE